MLYAAAAQPSVWAAAGNATWQSLAPLPAQVGAVLSVVVAAHGGLNLARIEDLHDWRILAKAGFPPPSSYLAVFSNRALTRFAPPLPMPHR